MTRSSRHALRRWRQRFKRNGILAILLAFSGLFAGPAAAIGENNFATDYTRLVGPYYETGVTDTFVGKGKIKISYRVFDRGAESPAIVILPGQSEPYRKYAELIYDLGSRGYSIYIIDHRGQGASDHLTDLHDLSHVDSFDDYVADVETFMDKVVLTHRHAKLFLLAHSMGGAIGALYVFKHPGMFAAVVLSSPMFGVNTRDHSHAYAFFGSLWKVLTGDARSPVDGLNGYQYDPTRTVEQSHVTSSRARWDMNRLIIQESPGLAIGGVSYGWLYAALSATIAIDSLGSVLTDRVVILEAGRDQIVRTEKYERYCSFRPALCVVVSAPFIDAEHEILQERDAIRDRAVELVLEAFR